MIFENKTFEAAIFDMDGTMFDTERLRFKMLKEASLELYNEEILDSILYDSLGISAVNGEILAKKQYGDEYPYKAIRERADNLERQYVRENGVPVKDGLYNLLERLKKNHIFIALATSSRREIAEEYLIRAKVLRYFDILVCGDDVDNGKPDPEIFIKAASELSCDPSNCLIFEDSENGILAASASGGMPIFIKDIKDISESTKKLAFKSYLAMSGFIEDIIPLTHKFPVPDLNEQFPFSQDHIIAGIHGFGAIGGGYLAQIFSHWDGYTRPYKIIGATRNENLRQIVNSIGKYNIKFESLAYFQTIEDILLIDIQDDEEVIKMYEVSKIIGLSLPESVIRLQANVIAKALLNRYEKELEPLTLLIIMNKINPGRFVRTHIMNALKTMTDTKTATAVIKNTYFCETVVNRMVSAIPYEVIMEKLQNNIQNLHRNIFQYSDDLKKLFEFSQIYHDDEYLKNGKRRKKRTKNAIYDISNFENFSEVSKFANELTDVNLTLFSSEPDMPLFASDSSPLLSTLRQIVVIDDIKSMQEIKNKLSNGTHAIIAWYSRLLGYNSIGQGMGDPRVEKLALNIMRYEIKPALLIENPDFQKYITSFITNFIKRCRISFKDKCSRVGRDPLRKLQNGERIIGAIQLAQKYKAPTKNLEFGVACAILYSIRFATGANTEAGKVKELFEKNHSVADILTYSGDYNKSKYPGLDLEQNHELIDRIQETFNRIEVEIPIIGEE